ncbi:TOG array regulator of axonemal microtubules protein 1 [Neosynchiropus ocellatus]
MILGLISQELHDRLLDQRSYQNRINGVEELKGILSDVDMTSVAPSSIEELIHFLPLLLDDINFKVLYGALQVLNLLVQKLDTSVARYIKHIISVALKTLGGAHAIMRIEYMCVFRQVMKSVPRQQVLDLVLGSLRHKSSRVREDVLNIIIASMLTHPRSDFDILKLCFEVAPLLADSKRKVRHAALELFAVFDHCLETGKKQPLMKAVDMVELNEDAEGLMSAVQTRRARHILPRLNSDGIVVYGLVVPKPGQRGSPQCGPGPDLDWVMNGGRVSSARSCRTEPDYDSLHGYGRCGLSGDDLPSKRRIVSAAKGKNKLPWDTPGFSSENHWQTSNPSGRCSEQVAGEDVRPLPKSPETYVPSFSCAEPQKPQSFRRKESPARLRRSGSLNLDADVLNTISFTDSDNTTKGRLLSKNPSVERTFSLPSNSTTSSSFLLPSYPLAALPGGTFTPTLSRRHADSSLSMSNTWPNKRDSSPNQRDPSPWRDALRERFSVSCEGSPRTIHASLPSPSLRRALNCSRSHLSVSPGLPSSEQTSTHNSSRSPERKQQDSDLHLACEEEDSLDLQEMMNSLRSLHSSAAKKRAKASLGSSDLELDPDSPDSAVRLDLSVESPLPASRTLTSSASESGLSSLSSVVNSSTNGIRTSPRSSSGVKPHVARVPSAKLRSCVSMDFSSLPGLNQRNQLSPEVGVVGQWVANGTMKDAASPPPVKPALVEPFRTLKGSQSNRNSPASDMPEVVVGRGMFGVALSSSPSGLALSPELADPVSKHPTEVNDLAVSLGDGDEMLRLDEGKERGRRVSREKRQPLEQADERAAQTDQTREKLRHRVRQMLSDSPTDDEGMFIIKGQMSPSDIKSPSLLCPLTLHSQTDLQLNGRKEPARASPLSSASPVSPLESQSTTKCFTPPHQPSPPTLPPNPQNRTRVRRPPSLNRSQPTMSQSSDVFSTATTSLKKNPSDPAELGPVSKPDQVLSQSLSLLNSDDWEKKIEGLTALRSLAQFHPDTLQGRLHDVCLALIQEVKNLRSGVSRVAVCTLGDFYKHLQKTMDQELEGTVKALLQKTGESNTFIRQDVDAALDCMVEHCTPTRCINALIFGGLGHLNTVVRRCTAQHLDTLVEKVGAARLLSGGKDMSDKILPAVAKLAQDSSQEPRYYGRRMLLFLSYHPDFEKILEKYIPAKELPTVRDTVFTLQTKGLTEMPQNTQSARGRRSLPGSGTVRASSLTREPANRESHSNYTNRTQARSIADKTEYISQISGLLSSKDFRERIKGIDQLVADCKHNPNMVINSIFPVFDAFKGRLQESNSKVNLCALESLPKIIVLMKDNLSQVLNFLVPAIVDNHLNSKNNAIYSAAVGAINALISNIDNIFLLQPFCTKARFSGGKAKVDLIEKVAELVPKLHPNKPQMVEQKVLPLLWYLLGSSAHSGNIHGRGGTIRAAITNLCQALYAQMGPGLAECAASQPLNVHKSLNDLLRTFS